MQGEKGVQGDRGLRGLPGSDGADGRSITGESYNGSTGQLTLAFSDKTEFTTGDLRGSGSGGGGGGDAGPKILVAANGRQSDEDGFGLLKSSGAEVEVTANEENEVFTVRLRDGTKLSPFNHLVQIQVSAGGKFSSNPILASGFFDAEQGIYLFRVVETEGQSAFGDFTFSVVIIQL